MLTEWSRDKADHSVNILFVSDNRMPTVTTFQSFCNYLSDIQLTSSSQPFETLWSTDKSLKEILLTEGSEIRPIGLQKHLKSGHF